MATPRAALYARYSTDLQSVSSTADQFRVCEARAAGMAIVARHADDGVSGSTPVAQRPGGRALLADALAHRIDVLIVESLDRISRDQVDLERTVRRLEHCSIRIIGVSDGYDSQAAGRKVIRAVRGIVAELYLDDLRAKTHRGLAGKVERGFIASGKSYGYSIVKEEGGSRYRINEEQAPVVYRIFERYAEGQGVQRIAHDLNHDRIASPRGKGWAVSAIYGSPTDGSGLLNNRLYVGELVWNRSQWIKDPDTGRRQRMVRPRAEWHVRPAPELRIVPDDLWQAAQERIHAGRDSAGYRAQARPPRTLFGGLLRCPYCAAPMIAVDARRYGCAARKDRGPAVCPGFAVSRDLVDQRMLSLLRDDLLSAEAQAEFARAIAALSGKRSGRDAARRRQIAQIDDEIGRLTDAIARIGYSAALGERLVAAEAARAELLQQTGGTRPARLDPHVAFSVLRMDLKGALERDREKARALIRRLIPPVTLTLEEGQLWGEVDLGEAVRLVVGAPTTGVAGTRYPRCRRRLRLS